MGFMCSSVTRRCNVEATIFESSHFCQPLFEGNFTITPEWVSLLL